MQSPKEIEPLRDGAEWVRRLARRLVASPEDAEDLAQDAWVALLQRTPGSVRHPRAWLSATLSKLRSKHQRAHVRRTWREEQSARTDHAPAASDLVAEVELQEKVTRAVLDLAEPLRDVLLLHFHRELSVRAIGNELGIPSSTVHNRIDRGLALLRERLDESHHGDRQAWVLAFQPLVPTGAPSAAPITLPLLMSTQVKLAGVFVVLLLGVVAYWQSDAAQASPVSTALVRGLETPQDHAAPDRTATLQEAEKADARLQVETVKATPPASANTQWVAGKVVGLDGQPLGHLTVVFVQTAEEASNPSLPEATSASDGSFRLEIPAAEADSERTGSLRVRDANYVTVVPGHLGRSYTVTDQTTIIVSARHQYRGLVTNRAGQALTGASIQLDLGHELFRRASRENQLVAKPDLWKTTSDADGFFFLDGVPGGPGIQLRTELRGYPAHFMPLPDTDDLALEVMLSGRDQAQALWGVVVLPDGTPAPGAHVSAGLESVLTDKEGRFELKRVTARVAAPFPDGMGVGILRAALRDYRPAELRDQAEIHSPVRLVLGAEPLSIRGQVVDSQGNPMPGANVWCEDQTRLGFPVGGSDSGGFSSPLSLEQVSGGQGTVVADALGRFELSGLLDREYVLAGQMTAVMANIPPTKVRAGSTGVQLIITTELHPVAGHVRDTQGSPIAGLNVQVMRAPNYQASPWSHIAKGSSTPSTTTDSEGYFDLGTIALKGNSLSVYGNGVTAFNILLLEEAADPQSIVVRIAKRASLQVQLESDPQAASQFQVLNDAGDTLKVVWSAPNAIVESDSPTIVDGLSQIVHTTQEARWLVLKRGDEEVARLPLALKSDELNIVRY